MSGGAPPTPACALSACIGCIGLIKMLWVWDLLLLPAVVAPLPGPKGFRYVPIGVAMSQLATELGTFPASIMPQSARRGSRSGDCYDIICSSLTMLCRPPLAGVLLLLLLVLLLQLLLLLLQLFLDHVGRAASFLAEWG